MHTTSYRATCPARSAGEGIQSARSAALTLPPGGTHSSRSLNSLRPPRLHMPSIIYHAKPRFEIHAQLVPSFLFLLSGKTRFASRCAGVSQVRREWLPREGLERHGSKGKPVRLRLLGEFDLVERSRPVSIGTSCQRLLALVALSGGQVHRVRAAGQLWPDVTAARANANLRSVLWRLQHSCSDALHSTPYDIRFTQAVYVDIYEVQTFARRLLDRSAPLSSCELGQAMRCNLREDIASRLGGGEWLAAERERHRQLRLHALEALTEQLIAVRWFGAAIDTASAAVRADPFRESARQLLVKAYLAEGSLREARRQHAAYRDFLRDRLGLAPTERYMRLLEGMPARTPAPSGSRRAQGRRDARCPARSAAPDNASATPE